MTPKRAALETVYIASLAVWLGLIVMTGLMAATVFPMMRDMEPTLGKYQAYTGEHWRIAAGRIANRGFVLSSIGEGLCLIACVTSLVFLTVHKQLTYVAAGARWATAGLLLMVLGYSVLVLRPRMAANVGQYWKAAEAGDNQRAEVFAQAFNADHPTASGTLAVTAVALVVALAVAAWTLTREAVVARAGSATSVAGGGVATSGAGTAKPVAPASGTAAGTAGSRPASS
ncbi:MAG TPA: hypothetical protein VD997_09535 [Phycisphaerales bacterium]|nr:hypothetical protein [Phycisphaerales bacterium]